MFKKNKIKIISSSQGYSLIEMLVVLSVIIILIMINLPLLQQYQPTMKLKGESRELATELRYAQQLTLTEQVVHLVRFFPSEKKYRVIRAEEGEDEEIIKEIYLNSPIIFQEITFTDNQVSFNTAGGSSEDGQVILTNNEDNNIVEVKPSGYVKIIY
ncbi:MAG: prepilin-type N-terminal cleavage/methylation domain-containing protein [bacterium]